MLASCWLRAGGKREERKGNRAHEGATGGGVRPTDPAPTSRATPQEPPSLPELPRAPQRGPHAPSQAGVRMRSGASGPRQGASGQRSAPSHHRPEPQGPQGLTLCPCLLPRWAEAAIRFHLPVGAATGDTRSHPGHRIPRGQRGGRHVAKAGGRDAGGGCGLRLGHTGPGSRCKRKARTVHSWGIT